MCKAPSSLIEIKVVETTKHTSSHARAQAATCFVPIFRGLGGATAACTLGLAGTACLASVWKPGSGVSGAIYYVVIVLLAVLCLWFYAAVVRWLLFTQKHPKSAAAVMSEDAVLIDVPSDGGEGKEAVVVGGGISGLATAHYLLRAGFAKVTLVEGRTNNGGNNEPHFDQDGSEHATTCVFTSPSQQPHYAELCRQLDVEQTSHELWNADGTVVLDGKAFDVKMGGSHEMSRFMWRAFWVVSWRELLDGIAILFLLYYQYQLQPESPRTVVQLLGPRLTATSVFRDFYMGWVGVNVWCRFNDLDSFPAQSFATFIFEYACPLKVRDTQSTPDCCVLDGRLLRALETNNLSHKARYEQHARMAVVKIRKDRATGKKYVVARRQPIHASDSIKAAVTALSRGPHGTHGACDGDASCDANNGVGRCAGSLKEIVFECDVVVLATQPEPGLAILKASERDVGCATTSAELTDRLSCPDIPPSLPDELAKWPSMECFTFVHRDEKLSKGRAWVHETLLNASTGSPYAHYAIHPRMGNKDAKLWISYVYGREHAADFVAHHLDGNQIVEILTPTLPIFTGENTCARNQTWRAIDDACSDIFWTSCCRSGLQFHNNGILSAKRVVSTIVGKGW